MTSRLLLSKLSRSLRSVSLNRNVSVVLGISSLSMSSSAAATTLCEGGTGKDILKKDASGNIDWSATQEALATQLGQQVQKAVDTGIPYQFSYGFVCGYCSGYALKKIGRIGAIIGGLGFMTLQTLSYSGYIKVDHDRMKKDVEDFMDLNDDGKIDADDTKLVYKKIMSVLEYNMPSGGGFAAGFVGGIRSG